MKALNLIAFVLVIVGGLNWGLMGLFEFNLVETLLESLPLIEKVVYVLVGLSAIVTIFSCKGMFKGSSNSSQAM